MAARKVTRCTWNQSSEGTLDPFVSFLAQHQSTVFQLTADWRVETPSVRNSWFCSPFHFVRILPTYQLSHLRQEWKLCARCCKINRSTDILSMTLGADATCVRMFGGRVSTVTERCLDVCSASSVSAPPDRTVYVYDSNDSRYLPPPPCVCSLIPLSCFSIIFFFRGGGGFHLSCFRPSSSIFQSTLRVSFKMPRLHHRQPPNLWQMRRWRFRMARSQSLSWIHQQQWADTQLGFISREEKNKVRLTPKTRKYIENVSPVSQNTDPTFPELTLNKMHQWQ